MKEFLTRFFRAVRREYVGVPLFIVSMLNIFAFLHDFGTGVAREIQEVRDLVNDRRWKVVFDNEVVASGGERVYPPTVGSLLVGYTGNGTADVVVLARGGKRTWRVNAPMLATVALDEDERPSKVRFVSSGTGNFSVASVSLRAVK